MTKKLEIHLVANTKQEAAIVVEVPSFFNETEFGQDLIDLIYEATDGSEFTPDPEYWERSECCQIEGTAQDDAEPDYRFDPNNRKLEKLSHPQGEATEPIEQDLEIEIDGERYGIASITLYLNKRFMDHVTLERCGYGWGIFCSGYAMTTAGRFEYQRSPSNRDGDFNSKFRYATPAEAIKTWKNSPVYKILQQEPRPVLSADYDAWNKK